MIEEFNKWIPLIQLIIVVFIIPVSRMAYTTIKNQNIQMGELKEIIVSQQTQFKNQQKQIDLLESIVFESSDSDVIKKHLMKWSSSHAKE